jgi:RsiW-degrading membrane proteinase PrsW (M82 family)
MRELLLAAAVGLLPVLIFLVSLVWLDSYKLVPLRNIVMTIAVGGVSAAAAAGINTWLLDASGLELPSYSRWIAPLIEEPLKAAILVFLIRTHRVGFLVDAAIVGFAAGAGFALVENIVLLGLLGDTRPVTWIIRGVGTALMHGGTTALFAIVAKTLSDRRESFGVVSLAPALALAILVHGAFNHFWVAPVTSALLVLVLLPPLLFLVFQRSERALRQWLGTGFDADVTLLELIHSGEFRESRPGRYLQSLTDHFAGEVVADMLCFLRLHVELAIRAKGELMLRESGFRGEIEPETRAKLDELKYLEGTIGPTGKLAMKPFLDLRGRELWQRFLLERS